MDGSPLYGDASATDCGWTFHIGALKIKFGVANGPKIKVVAEINEAESGDAIAKCRKCHCEQACDVESYCGITSVSCRACGHIEIR